MTFGKRQSGVGGSAQALNVGMAAARNDVVTETAPATGSPIRWFIAFVVCGAMLYGLVKTYGPDILRDHRLAGTWQPAYDLRATDGKCKRTNFVVTFCEAKIKSVAQPDKAPIDHGFFMLFAGGGGEALVPVRSTIDRSAVSIFYSAETRRWNRTLSFLFSAGLMALFEVIALCLFWNAVKS
ncbi:hypothetical protein LQG66_36400 [Bradyrhizobium ontarionense]|uniref:DUF3592 domain-containing protein n=1 Tax=Bradyrhizobium ontarionense TaxID=2898149 RepID=A0ABY3RBH9_9BRAD|nr:hypothetical protein [Bradyrhizobium sp. A19]UFZ04603.1 hypothetical protein LQG66_36400 [Bradyrhizobium sp. A19]